MVNQIFLQDIKSCGNNLQVPRDTICLLPHGQILQDVNQTTIPLIQILLTGLGFFFPEINPFSGKIPGWVCLRRDSSLWQYPPFMHWRFWAQNLQLSASFFMLWPEDNLLCVLSSLEFFPWEPQKRLKPEKIPVCSARPRFQCSSRDPQILSASSKSSTCVKKISFCCFLRGGGKEKIR